MRRANPSIVLPNFDTADPLPRQSPPQIYLVLVEIRAEPAPHALDLPRRPTTTDPRTRKPSRVEMAQTWVGTRCNTQPVAKMPRADANWLLPSCAVDG